MRKLNLIERRMSMRKKYVKPTIKSVEWKFQNPVCSTVYCGSPCIRVQDYEGSNVRHDILQDMTDDNLTWHTWPNN